MKSYREDAEQRIVSEQAAHWLTELADGEPGTREAFAAWLKRSPRHLGEFLTASAVLKEFESAQVTSAEIEKAIAEAMADAGSNVVALQGSPLTPAPLPQGERGMRRWVIAAAVAVIAVGAAGIAGWRATHANTYVTDIGEQRAIRLADGSLLHLNTRSRVKVDYSENARDIRLLEGEALFTVEHDVARPFRVDVNGTIIQALGTQFDVYRSTTGVTVSVTQGAVQVLSGTTSIRLDAGEQAAILPDGAVAKRASADLTKALAWRERRLVFQDERLEDIVAEVNRYSSRPIRIEGAIARNRTLTGTFNADDPDSLLLFIAKLDELAVERSSYGIVIKVR